MFYGKDGKGGMLKVGYVGKEVGGMDSGIFEINDGGVWDWDGNEERGDGWGREIGGSEKLNFGRMDWLMGGNMLGSWRSNFALLICLNEMFHIKERRMSFNYCCWFILKDVLIFKVN